MSTIATIRSAFRHKFFPAKTHRAAAAISGLGKNLDPIDEHYAFKLPLALTRVIPSKARDLTYDRGLHDLACVAHNQP